MYQVLFTEGLNSEWTYLPKHMLFKSVLGHALRSVPAAPPFTPTHKHGEMSWAQHFLKFIITHYIRTPFVVTNGRPIRIITHLKEEFKAHAAGNAIGTTQKTERRSAGTECFSASFSQIFGSFCRQLLPIKQEACLPATQFHILTKAREHFLSTSWYVNWKNYSGWSCLGHVARVICRQETLRKVRGRAGCAVRYIQKRKLFWEHSSLELLKV